MTLQNTDISARLWNPCAKGGEQPFRQGAICQQDQRTSGTELRWGRGNVQGTSGEGRLAALLSPHVTPPGTSFRSFGTGLTEQISVVFLDLEMLPWSPCSLTFSRVTEAMSSITGLWVFKWRRHFTHCRDSFRSPSSLGGQRHQRNTAAGPFRRTPRGLNRRVGVCEKEEGQLNTCRVQKRLSDGAGT